MSQALDHDTALALLRQMTRIRRFEERCVELYSAARIRGFVHLYIGEEAVAVGVLDALTPEDDVVATYREHGHALVRGVPADAIMAEMYGMQEGCSRGRGGSMHLFDVAHRFFGGNAIVGGGLPVAVGLALAAQDGRPRRRGRMLLRRGRGGRGRVPRVDEPRRAVEAAGALLLREQLVRDGDVARPIGVRDRHRARRLRATRCRPGRSTAWTCSRCATRPGARWSRSGRAPARTSSSCAPTGSGRTRCTTRSAIATRPRSSSGRARTRSRTSSSGARSRRKTSPRLDADAAAEVDAAVAFAEAGTPEPLADLTRFVTSEVGRT